MNITKTLLLVTTVFALSGCCMKSVEVKPEVNALDIQAAKAGSFNATLKVELQECCPSKAQEKIALDVQSKMTVLFDKLLNDEITLEKYNEKIKAASDALKIVILTCSSKKRVQNLLPGMSTDEAWKKLQKVNLELN